MPAQPDSDLVRVRCAAGNLLIEQRRVQGIAPALDAQVGANGIGEVRLGEIRWPLFVLDQDLRPDPRRPDFRFCVCVRDDDRLGFALACDSFELVAADAVEVHPLPTCMRNAHTPFDGLSRIGDAAALRLDLAALRRHLESLAP